MDLGLIAESAEVNWAVPHKAPRGKARRLCCPFDSLVVTEVMGYRDPKP